MHQGSVASPLSVLRWTLPRALVVSIVAAGSLLPMMPVEAAMGYLMFFIPPLLVVIVPFYWLLAHSALRVFSMFARWLSAGSIRFLVRAAIVGHVAGLLGAVGLAIVVDQTIRQFAPAWIGPLAGRPRGDDWYMLPIMVGIPPMGTLLGVFITIRRTSLTEPPTAAAGPPPVDTETGQSAPGH